MTQLLHWGGSAVTLIFFIALCYSLFTAWRKRRRENRRRQDLQTKTHTKVKQVHQYDIKPVKGNYRYPLEPVATLRRPVHTTIGLDLETATEQPYSIALLALTFYTEETCKAQRYFYVQPPENDLHCLRRKDITWSSLRLADTFDEYWQAGLKDCFSQGVLVGWNMTEKLGAVAHALKIYGLPMVSCRYIDVNDIRRDLYTGVPKTPTATARAVGVTCPDEDIPLTRAHLAVQILQTVQRDYPLYLPRIRYVGQAPDMQQRSAAVIAAAHHEPVGIREIFTTTPPDRDLLQTLIKQNYLTYQAENDTYYATETGLAFAYTCQ